MAQRPARVRFLDLPDPATLFPGRGCTNPELLLPYKIALADRFGVERGFDVYRKTIDLAAGSTVVPVPLEGLETFARARAVVFEEVHAAGEPYAFEPPRIVGPSDARTHRGVSRSFFVACLANAGVQSRSAIVSADGRALLDVQETDGDAFYDYFEFDPQVFHAGGDVLWMMRNERPAIELDEAFGTLVGAFSLHFGHFVSEALPRYLTAVASGVLPGVPVLLDASVGRSQRDLLRLLGPGDVEIVDVPAATQVNVKKLWCAPSLAYTGSFPVSPDPFVLFDKLVPLRPFRAIFEAMGARANALGDAQAQGRLYLKRKPSYHRKMLNYREIEAIAAARGFSAIAPETLSIEEQVHAIRSARYILGPDGSAMYLNLFARPGTKLCILNHPFVAPIDYLHLVQAAGVDVTVFTGPVLRSNASPGYPEYGARQFADYEIDDIAFAKFLDAWLS